MRNAVYGLIGALLLSGAAACSSSSQSVPPQAKASVSALASVPGADAKAILIRAGVPINGTLSQQLAFGRAMMVKANRDALVAKLDIPAQNRSAFEDAIGKAAKSDHVLKSHAGRVKFLDQDLPNLLNQYA